MMPCDVTSCHSMACQCQERLQQVGGYARLSARTPADSSTLAARFVTVSTPSDASSNPIYSAALAWCTWQGSCGGRDVVPPGAYGTRALPELLITCF
jgi:hypothetical protein